MIQVNEEEWSDQSVLVKLAEVTVDQAMTGGPMNNLLEPVLEAMTHLSTNYNTNIG